jgi:hypothetical protein
MKAILPSSFFDIPILLSHMIRYVSFRRIRYATYRFGCKKIQ